MSENEEPSAGTATGAAETAETDADGTDGEDSSVDVDPELRERVAAADDEELAREIASLRERAAAAETALEARETQADELESKLKRKQAEFKNFKKRMERKQEEEAARATEDLVGRLFEVRDNLDRALSQDEDADIRPGVERTLETFDRVLADEGIEFVEPEPGTEIDPERHEVLMRVESDRPEGTIDELHRTGYEMAGKVLRPAQVTVSDGG
jgi:molecular chaperone GrpE